MRGHQGRERGTRHPYHVITMAGAVAAWLEAMGVAEASWEAFVVWLDRMPPDVLRAVSYTHLTLPTSDLG